MLLGPRNCGKTALLKNSLTTLPNDPKPVYINGREGSLDSPGALARHLLTELIEQVPPEARQALIEASRADKFVKHQSGSHNADPSEIQPVLHILSELCGVASKRGRRPIFIVDEANVLTLWRQAMWQRALLRFFVMVRLCHSVIWCKAPACTHAPVPHFLRSFMSAPVPAEQLCLYPARISLPQTLGDCQLTLKLTRCAQVSMQENMANVVLCTSDTSFLEWLWGGELS